MLKSCQERGKINESDTSIEELHTKKQGRPLLLGKNLDDAVQKYITAIKESDGVVNTS